MTYQTQRIRQWLTNAALPLWATAGIDAAQGGFNERLSWHGEPDHAAAKRVRVQARQIYVYSHAHLLGLMPEAVAVAARGYDFLLAYGLPHGIAAGFVHSFDRDGTVREARRDTYDHAFVLFAFSWFYRATGRTDVRAVILALGDTIWSILRHPGGAGFLVDDSSGGDLHQNPHMHLFEAVLSAYDATGEPVFLQRARDLFALFRNEMFDRAMGVVREFHDAHWQPAKGEAGLIVEPGHHCEWVWLLKWYADRVGEPLCEEAFRLYDFVERHGRAGGGLLLYDELWVDGTAKKVSTRSWPQTEAIKAEIALAEARGDPPGRRADAIVEKLFDVFLDRPVSGGWIDWIGPDETPLVGMIPASTFYHVFLSFSEYMRVHDA